METKKLVDYFSNISEISLAYLFGSVVQKRNNLLSDIDIAILFNKNISLKEISEKILIYNAELILLLNNDKIDLVCLNTASPLLKFKILKNSIIIKNNPSSVHHFFQVNSLNEYYDFKPVIEMYEKLI